MNILVYNNTLVHIVLSFFSLFYYLKTESHKIKMPLKGSTFRLFYILNSFSKEKKMYYNIIESILRSGKIISDRRRIATGFRRRRSI